MVKDPIFDLFQRFDKLARRGLVQPLTHSCGTKYVTGFGDDDSLVLHCYTCDSRMKPGFALIGYVGRAVKEHF